jgi:dTDP-4-dehydrorhamnose reductase
MKKHILVLGGTGMLGNAVTSYFASKPEEYATTFTYRNIEAANKLNGNGRLFDPLKYDIRDFLNYCEFNYIINCLGIIKPFMKNNIRDAIYINSVFPHELAKAAKENNLKMIHITTDCVFSGKTGQYVENSLHDCLDDYGKSKSLGECVTDAMVIRTSIIGEEIHKNASLIAWAKSQAGKQVNGFTNHKWNGITTKEYAKLCDKIIQNDLYSTGLFHVHANTVTKFEMLQKFNERWNLNLEITPVEAGEACDRSMASSKQLNHQLNVSSFDQMIKEL